MTRTKYSYDNPTIAGAMETLEQLVQEHKRRADVCSVQLERLRRVVASGKAPRRSLLQSVAASVDTRLLKDDAGGLQDRVWHCADALSGVIVRDDSGEWVNLKHG